MGDANRRKQASFKVGLLSYFGSVCLVKFLSAWAKLSCNLPILNTLIYHSKFLLWGGKNWGRKINWPDIMILFAVQLLSHVWLSVTPWTAACQASLFFTVPWSLLKLMSIESVMPSYHLILDEDEIIPHPILLLPSIFPSIRVFSKELALSSGGQSIGVSALVSVLPMNIQDWFCLGLTGWIS